MNTSKIVGYVVKNNCGEFVHYDGDGNFVETSRPEPISQADAYRRLAAYIDEMDGEVHGFYVAPVFHVPTPLEKASAELGSLLQSLCSRHGLQLGLTQEQIEAQIAKELQALGAGGSSFAATGIPRMDDIVRANFGR